jgi:hypothetical protein
VLTFLTLLLGVAWGPQKVELGVPAGTASVEILLDGHALAQRHRAPWAFIVDLGPSPAPHHLDAVARDAAGAELGRTRQRINFPRRAAEATLALLPGTGGTGRVARLEWESLVAPRPLALAVTFDGRTIPSPDPRRIPLPPFVPERPHFLRAVVKLERGFRAEAEISFGGRTRDETSRELTAVALRVPTEHLLPAPGEMSGWLAAEGTPLRVAAVEAGDARVVFVLDADGPAAFSRLDTSLFFREALGALSGKPEVQTLFAYASRAVGSRAAYDVYPRSLPLDVGGGLLWALAQESPPDEAGEGCPRSADAATTAALAAAAGSFPRAVVLVLTGNPDASVLAPEHARAFLRDLGVPLFIWVVGSASPDAAAAWGGGRRVRTRAEFRAAARELDAALRSQRIVWVDGEFRPQAIALTRAAPAGVSLAR